MTDEKQHLEAITDIRNMMERSTRFLSLSGLSGVFAGIFALAGAGVAYVRLEERLIISDAEYASVSSRVSDLYSFFFLDATLVLLASLAAGFFFTSRKAKKQGVKLWDGSSRRAAVSLLIPLVAGGLFCLELLHYQVIQMIAPASLLFYGMALLNASKYTFDDIKYLGVTEIVLGLMAAGYHRTGLLFWAIGFGVVHIFYGAIMWYKYERS
jgi:hypothetical protein